MITTEEATANIGRKVVYTPYRGNVEEGVITGVSGGGTWIFVRFGADVHAKATAPNALDFALSQAREATT